MWCNTHKLICILHDAIGREAIGSCQAILENFMLSYPNFILAHLKWTGKRGPMDMLDMVDMQDSPDNRGIAAKAGLDGFLDTNKTTISTCPTTSTTTTCHTHNTTQHGRPCLHIPHMWGHHRRETTSIRRILLNVGPISMPTNMHRPTEQSYHNQNRSRHNCSHNRSHSRRRHSDRKRVRRRWRRLG